MRLAAVPYLNALPLIDYLAEKPRLAPPAVLDQWLKRGEVDLATAPITTLFTNPHFGLVPGIAIGTKGAVRSVRLVIKKGGIQLSDVQSIYLDIESRTSVLLLKVLLKFKYRLRLDRIHFVTSTLSPDVDAMLLIGDKALGGEGESLDLGQEWCEWAGLPFVFAAWISPKPVIDSKWISILQGARDEGLKNLDVIAKDEFIKNYLRQNISYDLGEAEIEGIKKFHEYVRELGAVKGDLRLRFY